MTNTLSTVPQVSGSTVLTAANYALPGFSSKLPLLVLDLQGNAVAQAETSYFLNARIFAFADASNNALNGIPSLAQPVQIRNLTDQSNTGQLKNDYFLRFENQQSLLGISAAKEYFLLGSRRDKSLIRNYLGYTLAAKIMENAPEIKLCEVFIRTPQGDLYQGVYSLIEKLPSEAVLFHRSSGEEQMNIDTWATINDPSVGKLSIPFIQTTTWDDSYIQPVSELSRAEEVLYSADSRTFYSAADIFDTGSFVDNFILGELTENYYGMTDAYYYYDTQTGTVTIAPIWNFELAFDNQAEQPAIVNQTRYDEAPYYKQLFKSPMFAKQINDNYLELINDSLREAELRQLVAQAAAYVEPAVQRDWQRWGGYRDHVLQPITQIELKDQTTPKDQVNTVNKAKVIEKVEPFTRQTQTYEEEIVHLQYHLREHSLHTAVNITKFDFSEQEIVREITLNRNPVWPVLFVALLIFLIRFARRYGV